MKNLYPTAYCVYAGLNEPKIPFCNTSVEFCGQIKHFGQFFKLISFCRIKATKFVLLFLTINVKTTRRLGGFYQN